MTCVCPILYGSTTSEDSTSLELGPVYADYKNGNVSIGRSWEEEEPMPSFILNPCCYSVEADTSVFSPDINYALLGWWLLLATISLVIVYVYPNKQPIRYRGLTDYVLMVLSAAVQYIIITVVFTSDGTASCIAFVIAIEILFPIHLLYYFIKSVQLAFIYRWSQAKASGDKKQMQWFFSHLYVLNPKAFPIISSIWLVISITSMAVQYTNVPFFEFAVAERDTFYSTIRCTWWDIPVQYQSEKSSAPSCDCIQFAFGIYDSPSERDSLESSCIDTALYPTLFICINSSANTEVELAPIGFTVDVCSQCVSPLIESGASLGDGLELTEVPEPCKQYLGAMFVSGVCGFPQQMPDLSTCRGCMPAHKPSFFAISALYYTLVVANGLAALYLTISKVDDRLEVRTENVIASIIGTAPAITIVLVGLSDDRANDLFDAFSPDFPLTMIAYHFAYQVYLIMSVFYPAYLVIYWEVLAYVQSAMMSASKIVEGKALYSAYSTSDVLKMEAIPLWMRIFYVLSPANSYYRNLSFYISCSSDKAAMSLNPILTVTNSRVLSQNISGSVVNASALEEDDNHRSRSRSSGEPSDVSCPTVSSALFEFGVATVTGKGIEQRYSNSENMNSQFSGIKRPKSERLIRSVKKTLGFHLEEATLSDKIKYGESCKLFEVESALQNDRVGNEFKVFSLKEFTIESFLFLKEMVQFGVQSLDKDYIVEDLLHKSLSLFETYIATNAEYQVNIAASLRDKIKTILIALLEEQGMDTSQLIEVPIAVKTSRYLGDWFGKSEGPKPIPREETKMKEILEPSVTALAYSRNIREVNLSGESEIELTDINSMLPEPGSPSKSKARLRDVKMVRESVIQMFSPAVREVHKLIIQDSWPRFQASKEYASFIRILEEEIGFMTAVSSVNERKS